MKYLSLFSIALFSLFSLNVLHAQITTPQSSPAATIEQKVGLGDITIEYSRPSVKGRKIFGNAGLLPFGKMWRAGANKNTIISFSDDAMIGGKPLAKGEYALFITPQVGEWEVFFYSNTNNWGTPKKWNEDDVALMLKLSPQSLPISFETLTYDIGNIKSNSADIRLMWNETLLSIPVSFDIDEKIDNMISKTLSGPSAGDYYDAGKWYFSQGKDLNKAYEWIHKSNEMRPKFWSLRQESLVLAKMGKKSDAIAVAKKSLEMAKEAGNDDYIRMNEKSIKEWSM